MSDDSTDPFCTACGRHLSHLLDEVEQRVRTPAEEAVLREAVRVRAAGKLDCDGPGFLEVDAAIRALDAAVDALLRENPAWGEEGQR